MNASAEAEEEFLALQDALAGRWSVERELGRGGMATVYLAREVALDRPVALKVLSVEHADDETMRARFQREATIGGRLSHPHIVPTYAVGEAAGRPFLVMGFADGESLATRLHRAGPLSVAECERVIREISWALGHMHALGILHRDVTLENILLERNSGRAVLVDFGIAVAMEDADASLLGTPAYLAPELIEGARPSVASDLYALATVAWALLAGRLPFHADDDAALLIEQLRAPIPSLADAAPATPRRIIRAVEDGLSKDPTSRPTSIETWCASWGGQTVAAPLAGPLERWSSHWKEVRGFYAFAATLSAVFGVIGSGGQIWFGNATLLEIVVPLMAVAAPLLLVAGVVHVVTAERQLRAMARSGYGVEDLRLALPPAGEQSAVARIPLLGRLVSDAVNLSLLAYFGSAIAFRMIEQLPGNYHSAYLYAGAASWAYVVFWTSLGISFLVPTRPLLSPGLGGRLRRRFWRSSLGVLWFRLATLGVRREVAAVETLHRPTELVLDLAIEAQWRALPPAVRNQIEDLPRVARELRLRVSDLRALARHIPTTTTPGGDSALLSAKVRAQTDDALVALEQLRLVLLQLGDGSAMTGELTAHLHDARTMEHAILAELGAHQSALRLLGRRKAGSPMPGLTPTPA